MRFLSIKVESAPQTTGQKPGIGTITCGALVVASMIGTGVFTSLGFQVQAIQSPFAILLLWGLGGVLALCGALSYAELALALPRSGGEYHFLSRIYLPVLGSAAGFLSATAGFSAPAALASVAFAEYLAGAFPGVPVRVAAPLIVTSVTIPHLITLAVGSRFQVAFTTLKVTLILAFVGTAWWMGSGQHISFAPHMSSTSAILSGGFAVSLMYVLYSYSGWNAVVYVIGEIRNPARSVLPALLGGTAFVTILYVLVNASFLRAAPMEELAGQVAPAQIAARHIFGTQGGRIMSGLIAAGLISAVSAMMWLGPRVLQTMAEDLARFRWLGVKTRNRIPARAILIQLTLVLLLLSFATFQSILLYTQFTLTLCSFLTVLGLIVLRYRQPRLARPYRCWLYPFPPLLFLSITGFSLWHTLIEHPRQSLLGLSTLAIGSIIHLAGSLRSPKSPGAQTP
jgi:APA family basic amino acid/polyamine antiporter